MRTKFLSTIILVLLVTGTLAKGRYIHHELSVQIHPDAHTVAVTDVVTIPAAQTQPVMHFLLHEGLSVTAANRNIRMELSADTPTPRAFGVAKEKLTLPKRFACKHYLIRLPEDHAGDLTVTLKYGGELHHPIEDVDSEYARSFSQTPGIIDTMGVYLGGSSYWIPWFNDGLITYNMTVSLPMPWDAVSQGTRTRHDSTGNTRHTRWKTANPTEEVYLIAARFTEYQRAAGATKVMAFLRSPDEKLAQKYLETTSQYLEMYRSLIGRYPYSKFALVENFWETGYGMPSFTLLGPRIIRFPFILHSSYPHELLHNWWGNGVFVDFDRGNWCEGLTAYMADHLIKEQRGQGTEYRRSTLQRYTDYVNTGNDFPLTQFRSRHNAATEAVGYGKSLFLWHMLRQLVGDDLFSKSFQQFYRENRFKRATFEDARAAFEAVCKQNLASFFDQWIRRTGAPELRLSDLAFGNEKDGYFLNVTLSQLQPGEPFQLTIPIAIYSEGETKLEHVVMTHKRQTYHFRCGERPLRVSVDPQFDVFRRLHVDEIPPALSKLFGADQVLILLPASAPDTLLRGYRQLAETWANHDSKIEVRLDRDVDTLPSDRAIWLFGAQNRHYSVIEHGMTGYNAEMSARAVRFGATTIEVSSNSFVVAVRHPANSRSVIALLTTNNTKAMPGLARKLPHYGKYSYLAFEGDEPANIAKGQWSAVTSPMSAWVADAGLRASDIKLPDLPERTALATLGALFSEDVLMQHVRYLASEELAGRGLGTPGADKAADYIVKQFRRLGLQPGGDNGSYFQTWETIAGPDGKRVAAKNIIGVLSGTKQAWADQSVVVSAHYDHLGRGWPDVHKGDEGRIHYGADDNASGVAVMLELARLLKQGSPPERSIVFVAFTAEESGLLGSKHYIRHMQRYPANKIMGVLNLDTVGRLENKKLLVINGASASEWQHIFMGVGFVTGVESEMVTQDLAASDQVSFSEAGIPAVQLFSGPHSDYHRPGDTADKIDAAGMVKVATFAREAIVYLAERPEPLTSAGSPQQRPAARKRAGGRRVSTGTMPDFAYAGSGVRVASVSQGSPAAQAGLQEGDVIVKLAAREVRNLREYSEVLKSFKPGDEISLTYLRADKETTTTLKLVAR